MSVVPKYKNKKIYQAYSPDLESKWDVIIIGSGMGGISCAAALAKLGRKVLVLEQHYIPGGYTHMFARKGYQWDVGVHVMGEMTAKEIPAKMMKWLSNGKVTMNTLGNPYDQFFFPDDFDFKMPDDEKVFLKNLKERFPADSKKLDKYWKLVKGVDPVLKAFFLFQTLPYWLEKILSKIMYTFITNWWRLTTEEVIARFDFSNKVKLALTSHWGYCGNVPKTSSFGIHALTHTHFWNGGYYPQGGAKMFAETFLANVVQADGKIVTKAWVDEVLIKDNRATGVRMQDGTVFEAPIVISAAGAKTTVNQLMPADYRDTEWARAIRGLKDSPSYLCLNLGFKGDIRKAGALAGNMWLYSVDNNDVQLWDVTDSGEIPHLLYVSFPSLKDPDHEAGSDLKETGECITFIDWSVFEKWQQSEFGKREKAYVDLKESIARRMLAQLKIRIPDIMQHLDFYELSTPLTSKHFANASKGAIYGLDASVERFACKHLRTRTPIKNFYMTGVDVASLGVVAGMTSGIMTAATIDKRAYLRLL